MNELQQSDHAVSAEQSATDFCLLMMSALQFDILREDDGVFVAEIPEAHRGAFGSHDQIRFTCASDQAKSAPSGEGGVQVMLPHSALFDRVVLRMRDTSSIMHAAPSRQLTNVHEIAQCLLQCYRFDEGQIHLAGCNLEDRPIICLSHYLSHNGQDLGHEFYWPDGQPLRQADVRTFGLSHIVPATRRLPRVPESELTNWMRSARNTAGSRIDTTDKQLIGQSIVWCKFAKGKVAFVSEADSVELPFGDWAQSFLDGTVQPPPYHCPRCRKTSYHLTTTDDGTITVAEGIGVCAESGKRVLESDLETCAITGMRLLSDYVATCPLTGDIVSRNTLQTCHVCHQSVSPSTMKGTRCTACRRLHSVSKDDTRIARLLGEFPGLDRWRRWQISEPSRVYVLVGKTFWRRVLLVVNKESMEPLHLATGGRLANWASMSPEDFDSLLR